MLLNFNQKKAVNTIHGPCLVLAGAGSGKTTVIISKIIKLIQIGKYHLDEIFAITFTNKAAREMKERVKKKIQNKYKQKKINIFTFHSLGMKIIKNELDILKYNKNYSLFNQFDQFNLIKRIVPKYIKKDNNLLKKILIYISYQKNQLITPKKAIKNSISNIDQQNSQYYKIYNKYLRKYNAFDFDDLIYLPIMLLKNYSSILYKWKNYIKYLLIDEYQDTNHIQYELIKILTQNNSNFTFVGDDDQSIYSWRGANSENLSILKQDYPNLKIIKLEHNYRSSKRILNVANKLISHNPHFIKKKLFSNLDDGIKIKIFYFKNEHQEAEKIIENILLHKSIYHNHYKDYVILYRNNYQSKIFEKFFIEKKIPYFIHSNFSFFNQIEIKDLISYLKFIINQNNDVLFLKIINIPSRKIGNITVQKIKKWAKKKKKSYFNILLDIDFQKKINKNTLFQLNSFYYWIKEITEFSKHHPSQLLNKIIHDIQYKKWLLKKNINNNNIKNLDFNNKIYNIKILSHFIKKALIDNINESSNNLLDIITQLSCYSIDTHNQYSHKKIIDKIQLMTIHASKGLEFSSVFIVGMEEGILPHQKNINNNIYEERRLLYVAITRAKKELTFSYCKKRYFYGSVLHNKPSRFLYELSDKDIIFKKKFNFI